MLGLEDQGHCRLTDKSKRQIFAPSSGTSATFCLVTPLHLKWESRCPNKSPHQFCSVKHDVLILPGRAAVTSKLQAQDGKIGECMKAIATLKSDIVVPCNRLSRKKENEGLQEFLDDRKRLVQCNRPRLTIFERRDPIT